MDRCECPNCVERRAWDRAYWMIARARSSLARSNAARNRTGIREAIDELDHYLDTYARVGYGWSGSPLVFLEAGAP